MLATGCFFSILFQVALRVYAETIKDAQKTLTELADCCVHAVNEFEWRKKDPSKSLPV